MIGQDWRTTWSFYVWLETQSGENEIKNISEMVTATLDPSRWNDALPIFHRHDWVSNAWIVQVFLLFCCTYLLMARLLLFFLNSPPVSKIGISQEWRKLRNFFCLHSFLRKWRKKQMWVNLRKIEDKNKLMKIQAKEIKEKTNNSKMKEKYIKN